MKAKRFLATLPKPVVEALKQFASENDLYLSVVVQRAITITASDKPTNNDIVYVRGETEGIQLTFSDTSYQLLELWKEQTGLSKSKLITYSLEKTIIKGEKEL